MLTHQFTAAAPVVALALLLAGGCASLDGPEHGTYDPLEGFNRVSYDVTDFVDRKALTPIARGYQAVLPDFAETGISNFFLNLRTIDSALNGFLQGKPVAGLTDLSRLLVNSTVGLGGLIDVAGRGGLVYQNEDLGQTFAVWGWTRSRYFYVPFLGPGTIRDIPSILIRSAVPRLVMGEDYHVALGFVDVISTRARLLNLTELRDTSALDGYAFTRDAYLQRRKFDVYDGDPPLDDGFDDFDVE